MSIEERHAALSRSASQWLISTCNPFEDARGVAPPPTGTLPDLLRAAELHGVLPFVLKRIRRLESEPGDMRSLDDLSRKAVESARTLQVSQAGMELLLKHHGQRVLAAFKQAGIDAAIVKGPIFAAKLYAEPAYRNFTDIDILIPLADRDGSHAVMNALDFEAYDREYRAGRDYFEDVWLLKTDRRVSIEVHSDLVHNPKLRAKSTLRFDSLLSAGAGDPNDATALLFVAATHGATSHQFDRIQHLLDVALAASGAAGAVDWPRLREVCNNTGTRRAVFAALNVASGMFASRSLAQKADELKPSFGDRLGARIITPESVLDARSNRRSASSWRRKIFRQLLRTDWTGTHRGTART